MRVPHLSPLAYRRITIVAAVLLAIIIVTGAAVRLTNSGLGCPVGVSCPKSQLQAHGPSSEHATIEHVNRLFTGLVSVAVILAVLGSLVRIPRRARPRVVVVGLVAGVFAQAVLGQLTVAFDLKPQFVMAHFLVSILLLDRRARARATRRANPTGPRMPWSSPSHRRARPRAARAGHARAVHRHGGHRRRPAQRRRQARRRGAPRLQDRDGGARAQRHRCGSSSPRCS